MLGCSLAWRSARGVERDAVAHPGFEAPTCHSPVSLLGAAEGQGPRRRPAAHSISKPSAVTRTLAGRPSTRSPASARRCPSSMATTTLRLGQAAHMVGSAERRRVAAAAAAAVAAGGSQLTLRCCVTFEFCSMSLHCCCFCRAQSPAAQTPLRAAAAPATGACDAAASCFRNRSCRGDRAGRADKEHEWPGATAAPTPAPSS